MQKLRNILLLVLFASFTFASTGCAKKYGCPGEIKADMEKPPKKTRSGLFPKGM